MAVSVTGLNAFYGRAHILFDVALQIHRGAVMALLGRNGAGKSTTMKSIIGLVTPAAGGKSHSTACASRPSRPMRFAAWASAMCRKTGASSPS